jgi:hypothetical protein
MILENALFKIKKESKREFIRNDAADRWCRTRDEAQELAWKVHQRIQDRANRRRNRPTQMKMSDLAKRAGEWD